MRHGWRKISPDKCCTHRNWVFVIRAPVNGRILRRRCLTILDKRSRQQECKTKEIGKSPRDAPHAQKRRENASHSKSTCVRNALASSLRFAPAWECARVLASEERRVGKE